MILLLDIVKSIGARGMMVLGVIAMLALGSFISYQAGKKEARAECQVTALNSKIKTMETDIAIAKRAESDAKERTSKLESAGKENEEKIGALEKELRERPPEAVCRATDSDLRWLRDIR